MAKAVSRPLSLWQKIQAFAGVGVFGLMIWWILYSIAQAYGADAWWAATMSWRLGGVNALIGEDKPEQAVPLVRALLREHPRNAGLLYILAGLYAEDDRPLPSYLVLKAYFKVADGTWEENSWRYTSARRELTAASHPAGMANAGLKDNILDESEEAVDFYNGAPASWRKLVSKYALQDVLGQPALGSYDDKGLVSPKLLNDYPADCRSIQCANHYDTASLVTAAATGTVSITGSDNCCAVSLDDPDLRSKDVVLGEIDAALSKKYGSAEIGAAAEPLMAFLGAYSRMAIKQHFVVNFIDGADYWERKNE